MSALPNLFSPITIGNCEIRNRILVSGHMTSFTKDGLPNDRYVKYHEARAKGGVGLIVMEATAVSPEVVVEPAILHGWKDEIVPWFKGGYKLRLASGAEIELSRAKARALRALLNW